MAIAMAIEISMS